MKRSFGEKIFNIVNIVMLTGFGIILMIPMLYILKKSLDVGAVSSSITLWPDEFSLIYYEMVLKDKGIYGPFINTVLITVVGTSLALIVNSLAAYPMSRRDMPFGRFFVYYLVIVPMLFNGGLVPTFLVYKSLGMLSTLTVYILPALASGWNIVLIRNYYRSIPQSLVESATIDGANDFQVYLKIILPLSKPVLAAIALFTGVGFWNMFTPPIMYNSDPTKYTFAVKLREMVVVQEEMQRQFEAVLGSSAFAVNGMTLNNEGLSSAMMIVSIIPIILVYPFVQKHFASGIMVGAIKG